MFKVTLEQEQITMVGYEDYILKRPLLQTFNIPTLSEVINNYSNYTNWIFRYPEGISIYPPEEFRLTQVEYTTPPIALNTNTSIKTILRIEGVIDLNNLKLLDKTFLKKFVNYLL